MKKEMPDILYKYSGTRYYILESLKKNQIHFTKVSDFNDPFDSSPPLSYKKLNFDESKEILTNTKHFNFTEKDFNTLTKINSFIDKTNATFLSLVKQQNENMKNIKASCFSISYNNILMWSHYANNHKGICIGYLTLDKPFSDALKVNYYNTTPIIDIKKYFSNGKFKGGKINKDEFRKPILSKYNDWSYEKEWRLLKDDEHDFYFYHPNSIKTVYFGCKVSQGDIDSIYNILKQQNENIEYYQMEKDPHDFKIIEKRIYIK